MRDLLALTVPGRSERVTPSADGRYMVSGSKSFSIRDNIPIFVDNCVEKSMENCESSTMAGSDAHDSAHFYNTTAITSEYFELQSHWTLFQEQLQSLVQDHTIVGPCVDIGAGKGFLQQILPNYVAVDYSFASLRNFVEDHHQRVCASAEALPFADKSVPMIVSIYTLEHVPSPDLALAEIDRVLSAGGLAFLRPAWNCTRDRCEGIPVRSYGELSQRQRLRKCTYKVRDHRIFKGIYKIPLRSLRYAQWRCAQRPTRYRFGKLPANYEQFWMSDSDACSRLDSFETLLYFASRGYHIVQPCNGIRSWITAGSDPLVVRKHE